MRSENLIFINRTNDVFRSKRSATINLFSWTVNASLISLPLIGTKYKHSSFETCDLKVINNGCQMLAQEKHTLPIKQLHFNLINHGVAVYLS